MEPESEALAEEADTLALRVAEAVIVDAAAESIELVDVMAAAAESTESVAVEMDDSAESEAVEAASTVISFEVAVAMAAADDVTRVGGSAKQAEGTTGISKEIPLGRTDAIGADALALATADEVVSEVSVVFKSVPSIVAVGMSEESVIVAFEAAVSMAEARSDAETVAEAIADVATVIRLDTSDGMLVEVGKAESVVLSRAVAAGSSLEERSVEGSVSEALEVCQREHWPEIIQTYDWGTGMAPATREMAIGRTNEERRIV